MANRLKPVMDQPTPIDLIDSASSAFHWNSSSVHELFTGISATIDHALSSYQPSVLSFAAAIPDLLSLSQPVSSDLLETGCVTRRGVEAFYQNYTTQVHKKLLRETKTRMGAWAETFGPHVELVLHDLTGDNRGTIIYIGNALTGRCIGDSMSPIANDMLDHGHRSVTNRLWMHNGKRLKNTTIALADHDGNIYGVICINVDLSRCESDSKGVVRALGHIDRMQHEDFDPEKAVLRQKLEFLPPYDEYFERVLGGSRIAWRANRLGATLGTFHERVKSAASGRLELSPQETGSFDWMIQLLLHSKQRTRIDSRPPEQLRELTERVEVDFRRALLRERERIHRGLIEDLKHRAKALHATFGSVAEFVVHDLHGYERDETIAGLEGDVTGRHIKGRMTNIGTSMLSSGTDTLWNYGSIFGGRLIKSTSTVLRDDYQAPFGILCMNLDRERCNRDPDSVIAELKRVEMDTGPESGLDALVQRMVTDDVEPSEVRSALATHGFALTRRIMERMGAGDFGFRTPRFEKVFDLLYEHHEHDPELRILDELDSRMAERLHGSRAEHDFILRERELEQVRLLQQIQKVIEALHQSSGGSSTRADA